MHVVQKVAQGVAVAAIRLPLAVVLVLSFSTHLFAAVLPEDRADILYHLYDGGGVSIDGPAILVRKKIGQSVSMSGKYYVDMVSSASIDVESTASKYSEERTETRLGLEYLHDKTIFSAGVQRSDENDYQAQSWDFGVSQEFFGGLSTVSLGYSRANDEVGKNGQEDFSETVDRQHFRFGLSQVISKHWLMDLNWETISDEGFLNNPYRLVRYRDPIAGRGFSYEPERYPGTRNSDALSLRSLNYLPYRASVKTQLRYFRDSWGIDAAQIEVAYIHPWRERWIFEGRMRYYRQGAADFYSDLFERRQQQNFLARDKELSQFGSSSVGASVAYDLKPYLPSGFAGGKVNLQYDFMRFEYDDFRDVTAEGFAVGEEPLYAFDAIVLRLFVSFWY